jgi:hypothetical protein
MLQYGDLIRIRRDPDDDWCVGTIVLASKTNPQSVMVQVNLGLVRSGDGLMGGYLALMVDYSIQKVIGLIHQDEYEVEVSGGRNG